MMARWCRQDEGHLVIHTQRTERRLVQLGLSNLVLRREIRPHHCPGVLDLAEMADQWVLQHELSKDRGILVHQAVLGNRAPTDALSARVHLAERCVDAGDDLGEAGPRDDAKTAFCGLGRWVDVVVAGVDSWVRSIPAGQTKLVFG